MRVLTSILSVLALGISVQAFTNGTLIPSYICGPTGDGYPKSAATIIPYLQLGVGGDAYNQFPPDTNGNALFGIAPSSRDIIGSFHNGLPINYQKSTENPVWLAPFISDLQTGLPVAGGPDYVITPGKLHYFIAAVNCPINTNFTAASFAGATTNIAGYNNPGVALDGLMLYALDTGNNKRIGTWVNVGPTLTNFSACTLGGEYATSVGIVHNQLVTGESNIANITWQAPPTIAGLVRFIGVGVADCGYGPINITYNVSSTGSNTPGNGTGNWGAPSVVAQGLNSQTPANLAALNAVFTENLAAPAPALPQGGGTATTTTTMYTQGATAGIAVGAAIGGALLAGAVVFFVARRNGGGAKKDTLLML
jgi:hypothetical protein